MHKIIENKYFEVLLLTGSFFILSLIGVLYHEVWLDEAHHFLLARDSSSFYELMQLQNKQINIR